MANAPSVAAGQSRLDVSYILPIAAGRSQARALSGYLARIARTVAEVVVVDGSPPPVFADHAKAWGGSIRHMRPGIRTPNGKVAGVMTGLAAARQERVIIADDDVRYRRQEIQHMLALLADHEVVRPQNYFHPRPWHARWDSARSLLARSSGGDWPGTLGVRRSLLLAAGGYSGDVLFENLEMVRTVKAAGGREAVALDLFVARRPPDARHFLSQRARQAYDEWARPAHFVSQLALLPAVLIGGSSVILAITAAVVVGAEMGRRRAGGARYFPPDSALWAPAWLAERAVTAWMALGSRLFLGGAHYRGGRLETAATPSRVLRQRLGQIAGNIRRQKSGSLWLANPQPLSSALSARSSKCATSAIVHAPALSTSASASQPTGAATGAPSRARAE